MAVRPTSRSDVAARHGITYRIARTPAELEAVYRLRYDAYRREGTIEAIDSQRFTDRYDQDPNMMILNVLWHDEIAGTLRIHIIDADAPHGPGLDTYRDVLEPFLEAGETIIDSSRFVTNPALRADVPNLHFEVLRLAGVTCDHFGVDWLLASVRREHAPFYRRYFSLNPLTEPRPYPGLKADLILMGERYPDVCPQIRAKYPVFRAEPEEGIALFGPSRRLDRLAPNDNQTAERTSAAKPLLAAIGA